jgi:hypothetical protein
VAHGRLAAGGALGGALGGSGSDSEGSSRGGSQRGGRGPGGPSDAGGGGGGGGPFSQVAYSGHSGHGDGGGSGDFAVGMPPSILKAVREEGGFNEGRRQGQGREKPPLHTSTSAVFVTDRLKQPTVLSALPYSSTLSPNFTTP